MKIVYGPKGTGKTKVVIADANALVESAKGTWYSLRTRTGICTI